jgi:DNA-binding MarR family transcriptional regulator
MASPSPQWIILNGIRLIVQDLREASRAAEARFGLSGAQLFVLQTLAETSGMSVNELATRTYTHQSSVSVVVKKLVKRKLVRARRARQDARRLELALTPAGVKVVGRAPHPAQAKLIAGLNGLSGPERARLARGIRRLVRGMGLEGREAVMFLEDHQTQTS